MRAVLALLFTLSLSPVVFAQADWQACGRAKSFAEQIEACTNILQASPLEGAAYVNRAIAFREIGELDRSLSDIGLALRLDPNNAGTYLEMGLTFQARSDRELAIAAFTEALNRDGTLVQAWFGRAIAYQDAGQVDLAEADVNVAVKLDRPLVAAFYIERGKALRSARAFDKAVAAFDQSIALHPIWVRAYSGRAASYEGMGDLQRAVADYRKCLVVSVLSESDVQEQKVARVQLEKLGQQ